MLATKRRRVAFVVAQIVLLALVATGTYIVTRPTVSASGTARLTIFKGTVQLRPATTTISHNGVTGELLVQSEEVTTGPQTWAAINFPDGSVTRLDSSTQLTITKLIQTAEGGWTTSINQQLGKSWNHVSQLVGGSTFNVTGPNQTTAEVRGTDFEVIVERLPNGDYVVRINNFNGAIDVIVNGNHTSVGPNQSSTVTKGATSATPPGPIPAGDLTDPFTVFNQTANTMTSGETVTIGTGFLTPPATTGVQPGAGVDGNTDLDFALGWPGSTYTLRIYAPDGSLFQEEKSNKPPIHIVVPQGAVGNWTYEVVDNQSTPNEAWVVMINAIRPSTQKAQPFFAQPPVPPQTNPPTPRCDHGVTAGGTDSWKVEARDAAGKPALSVSGLPSFGTFTDNHNGFGTVSFAPPADTADQVAHLTFTATFGGLTATLGDCTETVHALGTASSIVGTVTGGPGAGVTLSLNPGGVVTLTGAGGGYGFTGLGAGTYTVTLSVPSGYSASGATSATRTVDGANSAVANFTLSANAPPAAPPPPPQPPTLAAATLAIGSVGGSYAFRLSPTGGTAPFTWAVSSGALPAAVSVTSTRRAVPASVSGSGLFLDSAGLIGGTPTQAGTYNFTLTVTDANGLSASQNYSMTIQPQPTLTFVNPLPPPPPIGPQPAPPPSGLVAFMPEAEVGVAYTQAFAASGGFGAYHGWQILGGGPPGLSLDQFGVLSGIPTAAGDYVLMLGVMDANGALATEEASLVVVPAPSIDVSQIAGAYVSTLTNPIYYASPLINGTSITTVNFANLPSWLTLPYANAYYVSGPPPPQNAAFTTTPPISVTAIDARGQSAIASFTVTVAQALTVSIPNQPNGAPNPPNGVENQPYPANPAPVPAGGFPPYTYASYAGAPPPGVTVDPATGVLSGTPTTRGVYSYFLQVIDSRGGIGSTNSLTITIAPPPAGFGITTTTAPDGEQGVPYSTTLFATGGTPPYTWGPMNPVPWLTLATDASGNGLLSGTPPAAGTYSFPITVTDSTATASPSTLTLIIHSPPLITQSSLPNGIPGTLYGVAFTAAGGQAPFNWSQTGGTLPGGLSFSSEGTLAGTPNAPTASVSATYQLTDALGGTATPVTLSITVNGTLQIVDSLSGGTFSASPGVVGLCYGSCGRYLANPTFPVASGGTPFVDSGGNPSYNWTVSGNVPPGMTAAPSSGLLYSFTGTPTAAGSYSGVLTATDGSGATASANFTIVVEAGLPYLAAMPPGADLGVSYSHTLSGAGGSGGGYQFEPPAFCRFNVDVLLDVNVLTLIPLPPITLSSFELVPGLTLQPGGGISGAPTQSGTLDAAFCLADSRGVTSPVDVPLAVAPSGPSVATSTLPAATPGTTYQAALSSTGGTAPYQWSLVSATPSASGSGPWTLANGVRLDSYGHLVGTPTVVGPTILVVQVTDIAGGTSTGTVTMNTAAAAPAAVSASPSPSPTPAPTVSPSPAPSPTPSPTPTPEPSLPAPSPTPTASAPRSSPSPTSSPSASPSPTPSPSSTPIAEVSPSPTPTPIAEVSPTPTPTPTPIAEVSPSPTPTPAPIAEVSPSPTPTPIATVSPSPTPSPSPSPSPSPTP